LLGRGETPVRELPSFDVHARRVVAALQRLGRPSRLINEHSQSAIHPRLGTVITRHAKCNSLADNDFRGIVLPQSDLFELLMMAKSTVHGKGCSDAMPQECFQLDLQRYRGAPAPCCVAEPERLTVAASPPLLSILHRYDFRSSFGSLGAAGYFRARGD